MLAESGLGLVALAYAFASAAGLLTMPAIYLLATAWGVINALDTPARQAPRFWPTSSCCTRSGRALRPWSAARHTRYATA
ncbi:MAG TPA: hypothetical protein VKU77_11615 [Streptosporangiaceae bacterium]|nr:hypothetical protein [Streptosporangiaceae bacterium]